MALDTGRGEAAEIIADHRQEQQLPSQPALSLVSLPPEILSRILYYCDDYKSFIQAKVACAALREPAYCHYNSDNITLYNEHLKKARKVFNQKQNKYNEQDILTFSLVLAYLEWWKKRQGLRL